MLSERTFLKFFSWELLRLLSEKGLFLGLGSKFRLSESFIERFVSKDDSLWKALGFWWDLLVIARLSCTILLERAMVSSIFAIEKESESSNKRSSVRFDIFKW